ncbi:MAG: hypothetical protein AB7N65_19815, partial [Vicinamibacterales bacterium]
PSRVSAAETARESRIEWAPAHEWAGAMAADDRFVFPNALDDVPPETTALPPLFRETNWTRVTDGAIPDELAQRLSDARRRKKIGDRR